MQPPSGRGGGRGRDSGVGSGRGGGKGSEAAGPSRRWGRAGGSKGKGRGGEGGYRDGQRREEWDAAQNQAARASYTLEELQRVRPQRVVTVFDHLTVAADWPEAREPRSGSAFFLPLIWTALVFEEGEEGDPVALVAEGNPAVRQLETLGDQNHLHKGRARRATLEELRTGQLFWQQVFSGWSGWVRRLRAAMESFPGGRRGLVERHVQKLSVTACAVVYGDLQVLGALPHLSNARQSPDQEAILELDLMLRTEIEASVSTLYLPSPEREAAQAAAAAAKKTIEKPRLGGTASWADHTTEAVGAADAAPAAQTSAAGEA